jgi:release factor glutamine methyltransferase
MSRAFAKAGLDTPALDARMLVSAALGVEPAALIHGADIHIGDSAAAIDAYLLRRLRREPVSRILGARGFFGRAFEVTPATLDPRPDSETLIRAALLIAAEEGWSQHPIHILDIGTGTGCLLVTLLAELPSAIGLGTDISAEALTVARRNAVRNGVAGRALFALAEGLQSVPGVFQLLVSNPPYIRTGDIPSLEPEVRCFDPHLALDGGPDGLAVYRTLANDIIVANSCTWVMFETAPEQAGEVMELLESTLGNRLVRVRTFDDLSRRIRCVAAKARKNT